MPFPIVPIVAGGALFALFGAGAADKAKGASGGASTNAPGNVAATQQSTGGANGGAQAPSHADGSAQPGTAGTSSSPSADQISNMFGPGNPAPQGDIASGTGPGISTSQGFIADPAPGSGSGGSDPWAPTSGPALSNGLGTVTSPVTAVTGIGSVTARQVGDAFSMLGSKFGAIW